MMNRIAHYFYLLKHPRKLVDSVLLKFPNLLSDKQYIECMWRSKMPYRLNLKEPRSFNEKLQWIKLNDHRPVYTTMVDKYAVKGYVSNIIGDEYIIPTLGVWDKPEKIEWEALPNQFVLKCTHDSGGLVICKDKSKLDKQAAIIKLTNSLNYDYYLAGREWPYKNVPKRIIAEEYLEDEHYHELRDYKFFCFKGRVKAMFIATDRQNRAEPYFDFYDSDFNYIDMRHGHPNAPEHPEKPLTFDLMKELASKLSKDLIECRVDFYEVNGKPYFGELTLFHHGGWMPFDPIQMDYKFGEWIELPQKQEIVCSI